MNGYNFTMRVRMALADARREAMDLGHEYVGTEHVLLGLLCREGGIGVAIVESFGVVPKELRARVEGVIKSGRPPSEGRTDVPYTSRAKKVLELAMAEARTLNHSYVGTEHLLLGLIHEQKGIAAQLLVEAGITLDAARNRTLEILETGRQDDEGVRRAGPAIAMTMPRKPSQSASGISIASTSLSVPPSASMAASIIEAMAQDPNVGAVFTTQGLDVAKLAAALRALSNPPPAA